MIVFFAFISDSQKNVTLEFSLFAPKSDLRGMKTIFARANGLKLKAVFMPLLGLLAVSGCSTIGRELNRTAAGVNEQHQASARLGLNVSEDAYDQALDRWPWASGDQLHRRALILSYGASPRDLEKLDRARDPETEYDLLTSLFNVRL